jgi:hypothetical protein
VVAEQGLGDSLQFVRYLPALQARGYRLSLCVQPALQQLLRESGCSVPLLTPEQAATTTAGVWLPLLSLPRYLHLDSSNPGGFLPYLQPPSSLVAQWGERLAPQDAPLIGLHWQGNPSSELAGLQGRSLPLALFAPIAASLQIRLVALQKGPGHEQLQACSFRDRFVACQPQVDASWDFRDAAAIIRHCDLLITNDTAVAHLAGALGHPTWLLLHHVPDWRWGLQGDTTPWYPSLRLWRQRRRGDWPELLQRVLAGLQQRFPQAVVS